MVIFKENMSDWLPSSTNRVMLKVKEENEPLDMTDCDPDGTCKGYYHVKISTNIYHLSTNPYTSVKIQLREWCPVTPWLCESKVILSKECGEFKIHKRSEIRPAYPWS